MASASRMGSRQCGNLVGWFPVWSQIEPTKYKTKGALQKDGPNMIQLCFVAGEYRGGV